MSENDFTPERLPLLAGLTAAAREALLAKAVVHAVPAGSVLFDQGDIPTFQHLVLSGTSAVLVRDGEELIDVVNRFKGQGVLNLLALAEVQTEVDAAVHQLHVDDAAGAEASTATPRTTPRAAAR